MKSQPLNIQQNIPLAPYTTFKIGGSAKFFVEVSSEEALIEAVEYAKDNNLEFFVLGGGSNVLVSDKGFDGLIIRLVSKNNGNQPIVKMRMENGSFYLECWAGENLSSILKLAAESSLSGLEWAAGIPGTIGGAVRGNAGAFGSCMVDSVESVRIFDASDNSNIIYDENQNAKIKNQNYNSKLKILDKNRCEFDYRTSLFKENNNLIITSVVLKLKKGDKAEIGAKIKENIEKRTEKQPQGFSVGSFFKNPICKEEKMIKQFEADTGMKIKDDKIPAGWLIAEAGFLGKKVGNVQVSENHGNFVVNLGDGKAEDVIILASMIKQKIREKFNIQLSEEVQYVGF
jgi:UDP-N-acetylmuramate dehydrogenase